MSPPLNSELRFFETVAMIAIGYKRFGSPGVRLQTFCEKKFDLGRFDIRFQAVIQSRVKPSLHFGY